MSTATFDTLAAARALEAAGMESAQAAAVIEAVRAAVAEGVATKADLQAMEVRLIRWAVGIALAAVGLAVATVGLLLSL